MKCFHLFRSCIKLIIKTNPIPTSFLLFSYHTFPFLYSHFSISPSCPSLLPFSFPPFLFLCFQSCNFLSPIPSFPGPFLPLVSLITLFPLPIIPTSSLSTHLSSPFPSLPSHITSPPFLIFIFPFLSISFNPVHFFQYCKPNIKVTIFLEKTKEPNVCYSSIM